MSRVRVKICGITRLDDALLAVQCGADALGFVFYPQSPRALTVQQAQGIISQLPVFVSTVGLFVDAMPEEVERISETLGIDYLQFHGEESAEYCDAFARPYIKAVGIKPGIELSGLSAYKNAAGLLLDTWHPEKAGGTGERFDWSVLEKLPKRLPPCILAGGLHAGNVAAAIQEIKPYAVDVSSGVEDSPGLKSGRKIREFIDEVKRVGQ